MARSKIALDGTMLMTVEDTTAIASDVRQGKDFYLANGVKTTGTYQPSIYCTGIEIISNPTKMSYRTNELLTVSGISVRANYSNGTYIDVTNSVTYSPVVGTPINANTTVTVSYVEDGSTYTTAFAVTYIACTGISVTTLPTKTEYRPDETLDLTGMVVTATYSNGATQVVTSSCTATPPAGTLITDDTTIDIAYTENGTTHHASFTVTFSTLTIVSWANGTAAELKAMIDAHYAGSINLSDYWSLGDTRTITLPAMSATGVGESHASQSVQLVLMDSTCTGFTLTGSSTKPKFIVGMKQCLKEEGYMNSSKTNTNGWSGSARRTWCNATYKTAMDSVMPNIFKQFTWKQGQGSGISSGLKETNDYFALPPEKAIFGSTSYSFSDEAALYSQWNWYTTSSNRIKQVDGSNSYWWEASPFSGYSNRFCGVNSYGNAYGSFASNTFGVSPFGCI